MMTTIIVQEGQNLIDIALQYYGDTAGVVQLLADNEALENLDSVLKSGQTLLIDSTKVVAPSVAVYYKRQEHSVNTGDDWFKFASFSDAFSNGFDI